MKLRNKKTGEIVEFKTPACMVDERYSYQYGSLSELNEEWEDYEGPKGRWFISNNGQIHNDEDHERFREERKLIGNDFATKEEAEKVVEKLKVWKRLKDKGFEFEYVGKYESLCGNGFDIPIRAAMPPEAYTDVEVSEDLDLLFGGEE